MPWTTTVTQHIKLHVGRSFTFLLKQSHADEINAQILIGERKHYTNRKDDLYDLFPLHDLDLSEQIDS